MQDVVTLKYARTVMALLLLMSYTSFMNAQFLSHVGNDMLLLQLISTSNIDTMRS